ncbi:MAG: hypothetical protein EXQ85_07305 [Alphaproteobacteria bacterium]|nr:hypothetical protein [Alphaproteobacteria bacterium]
MATLSRDQPTTPAASRVSSSDRVERAIAAETTYALRQWCYARLVALALVTVWLTAIVPFVAVLYYYALLVVFAAAGIAHYRIRRRGHEAA